MKKILFLSLFLSALCFNIADIYAQGPQGGRNMTIEERAKRTTEWMKEELNLTEDQIAPVDSINLLFTKTQQLLFQAAEGDREKIRETMTALEKEKMTAFSEVLTEDQWETYKKKTEEMMQRRGGAAPSREGRRPRQ